MNWVFERIDFYSGFFSTNKQIKYKIRKIWINCGSLIIMISFLPKCHENSVQFCLIEQKWNFKHSCMTLYWLIALFLCLKESSKKYSFPSIYSRKKLEKCRSIENWVNSAYLILIVKAPFILLTSDLSSMPLNKVA